MYRCNKSFKKLYYFSNFLKTEEAKNCEKVLFYFIVLFFIEIFQEIGYDHTMSDSLYKLNL